MYNNNQQRPPVVDYKPVNYSALGLQSTGAAIAGSGSSGANFSGSKMPFKSNIMEEFTQSRRLDGGGFMSGANRLAANQSMLNQPT